MNQNGFFGLNGNGYFGLNGMYPLPLNIDDIENSNTKIAHDSYEVYVNRDYVGRKILLTPNERIKDIEGYLKERGFNDFTSQVEGNSFMIKANDNETENIKNNLQVYLKIR